MKKKVLGLLVIIMLFSSLALVGTMEFTEFEPHAPFPYLQVIILTAVMAGAVALYFALQKRIKEDEEYLRQALRDGQDLKFLFK